MKADFVIVLVLFFCTNNCRQPFHMCLYSQSESDSDVDPRANWSRLVAEDAEMVSMRVNN
jgi:hypothetical protein